MQVQRYRPEFKPAWDEFVRGSKNGTFLFLRDYMDYHSDRFADHSLVLRDAGDACVALLPANRADHVVTSHAGLTYGGFITDDRMTVGTMLDVFDTTLRYLQADAVDKLIYKSVPHIYHSAAAEEDLYALFRLNARVTRRDVLTVVGTQGRIGYQDRRWRGTRKARRHGLIVRASDDLSVFWDVLSANLLERYRRLPVHTLDEIRRLQARFPEHIKLFACYEAETMLAGVLVYATRRVGHTQYIAAGERGRQIGALDLLFTFLLEEVYADIPYFDFGASTERDGRYLNRGLTEQKEGFGARAVVHDHYEVSVANYRPGELVAGG